MFDREIERVGSGSAKWDAAPAIFGESEVLPMWVADMDFQVAEPISQAIKRQAEHGIFGYPAESATLRQTVVDRLQAKFNWSVEKDWLVFSTGIVHALHMIIKAFTTAGDGVVIQPPVYYPFFSAITNNGCAVIENQLVEKDGEYFMDFPGLKKCFQPDCSGFGPKPSRARIMLLCSPHNPVGRVWTQEELDETARIALANDALIISDEIHAELLYSGKRHMPTSLLSDDVARRTITCFSPSKTFNLAGLNASVLIIPDPKIRAIFKERTAGFHATPGVVGLAAMEAAFKGGDPWLEELISYLEGNLNFLLQFFKTRLPQFPVTSPQGTYLVWFDCRILGLTDGELRNFMRKKAKVGLDDGYMFGAGGSGYQRMNIACPRSRLEEGLTRIEQAVNSHMAG
jgi:cysteine-S-conjugate beta-lyase